MSNVDNNYIKNLVSNSLDSYTNEVLNVNAYSTIKNLENNVKKMVDTLKVQILNTITTYNNNLSNTLKNEIYSYLTLILNDVGNELKSKNAINIMDNRNEDNSIYKKIVDNIKNEIDNKLTQEIKTITNQTLIYYYSLIYNREHIMDTVKLFQNFYNAMIKELKEKFDYDLCDLNNNINFDESGVTSFINKDEYIAYIKSKLSGISFKSSINSAIKNYKDLIYNEIHSRTNNYKSNIKTSINKIISHNLLQSYYYEIIDRSINNIYDDTEIKKVTNNDASFRKNCITTVKNNKYVNDKIRELYDEVYTYIISLLNTGHEYQTI